MHRTFSHHWTEGGVVKHAFSKAMARKKCITGRYAFICQCALQILLTVDYIHAQTPTQLLSP